MVAAKIGKAGGRKAHAIEAALVEQMAVQKEALGTLSEDEQITLSYLLGKLIAANCDPL